MATATEAAALMASILDQRGELYQHDALDALQDRFGRTFVYENDAGNDAIAREVLTEFRRLTPIAVCSRGEQRGRPRARGDEPGRSQY